MLVLVRNHDFVMNQDSISHKIMVSAKPNFVINIGPFGSYKTPTRFCGGTQNADPISWRDFKRRPDFVAGLETPTRFCGGTQNADRVLWRDSKRPPDFVAGLKTPTRFCGGTQHFDPILWRDSKLKTPTRF